MVNRNALHSLYADTPANPRWFPGIPPEMSRGFREFRWGTACRTRDKKSLAAPEDNTAGYGNIRE